MLDYSRVAYCLEESSKAAVKSNAVGDSSILPQFLESRQGAKVGLSIEEIAWADSCLEYPENGGQIFDSSLVARCLEESSKRAVKDIKVGESSLAQFLDSSWRKEVRMSKEEIAWADSCVEYPESLDGDWNSMKEALLEILNSPHNDKLRLSAANSNGYTLNTDIRMLPSNAGIMNARARQFFSSVEDTGRADDMLIDEKIDDFDFKPSQGSSANEMYSSHQDIYNAQDKNILAAEDDFITLLNEILAESSLESAAPSTFNGLRKLRYLEEVSPANLYSTLASLSLNRNN